MPFLLVLHLRSYGPADALRAYLSVVTSVVRHVELSGCFVWFFLVPPFFGYMALSPPSALLLRVALQAFNYYNYIEFDLWHPLSHL